MERHIIIAQVGMGKYSPIKYMRFSKSPDGQGYYILEHESPDAPHCEESAYSFYIIYKELLESSKKVDTLFLVGTSTSSWLELCEYFAKKSNKDDEALSNVRRNMASDFERAKPDIEALLTDCLSVTQVKLIVQHIGATRQNPMRTLTPFIKHSLRHAEDAVDDFYGRISEHLHEKGE